MKAKVAGVLAALVMSSLLTVSVAANESPWIEAYGHAVAACGMQPNEIDLAVQNLMQVDGEVFGEIWAQEDGGVPTLISAVPEQYRRLSPGFWGGPGERLENHFPNGFKGNVWGWVELRTATGLLVERVELAQTPMNCAGEGEKAVEFWAHVVDVCSADQDQVSVRMQNQNNYDVRILGEIWAQEDGGVPTLISAVPEQYRRLSPGFWGGPEERLGNWFLQGFSGSVRGWAEMFKLDNDVQTKLGSVELGPHEVVCSSTPVPSLKRLYLPMLRLDPSQSTSACPVIHYQSGTREADGGISPGTGPEAALRFWIDNQGRFTLVTWSVTETRLDGTVRNILHENAACSWQSCSSSPIFGTQAEPKPFPGAKIDVTAQGYPDVSGSNCARTVYVDPPPGLSNWFTIFFQSR